MYEQTVRVRRSRLARHPIKQVWDKNGVAITSWCSLPSSFVAEALALLDWDAMVVDLQHGPIGFGDLVQMFQGIEASGLGCMVRLPWNDVGLAQQILDAGATGLICPMVNTREECEKFVGACHFPPLGYRSFGGARASSYYGEIGELFQKSRDATVIMAMIETVEGLENLDAIASVPGLDGIFVGPADLTASRGLPPSIGINDPFIQDAHRRIIAACQKNNIKAGINAATVADAKELAGIGYQFLALGSDLGLMMEAGREALKQTRGHLSKK